MSTFDDEVVLRYVLVFVKTIVERSNDAGVPVTHVQRQLAQLPPGALGRFEASVDTVRLAVKRFPGSIFINPHGKVYSCTRSSAASEVAPHAAPYQIARPPSQQIVSAIRGWPTASQGPKAGDPVEMEFKRSPSESKYKYQTVTARYPGSPPVDEQQPCGAEEKGVIFGQVGVITSIQLDHGIIAFANEKGDSAFFNHCSVAKSLLRRGEMLSDIFMAGQKVCFEAQLYSKPNGPAKWYATMVSTVLRGSASILFDSAGSALGVGQAKTDSEKHELDWWEKPCTSLADFPASFRSRDNAQRADFDNQCQSHSASQVTKRPVGYPQLWKAHRWNVQGRADPHVEETGGSSSSECRSQDAQQAKGNYYGRSPCM